MQFLASYLLSPWITLIVWGMEYKVFPAPASAGYFLLLINYQPLLLYLNVYGSCRFLISLISLVQPIHHQIV